MQEVQREYALAGLVLLRAYAKHLQWVTSPKTARPEEGASVAVTAGMLQRLHRYVTDD